LAAKPRFFRTTHPGRRYRLGNGPVTTPQYYHPGRNDNSTPAAFPSSMKQPHEPSHPPPGPRATTPPRGPAARRAGPGPARAHRGGVLSADGPRSERGARPRAPLSNWGPRLRCLGTRRDERKVFVGNPPQTRIVPRSDRAPLAQPARVRGHPLRGGPRLWPGEPPPTAARGWWFRDRPLPTPLLLSIRTDCPPFRPSPCPPANPGTGPWPRNKGASTKRGYWGRLRPPGWDTVARRRPPRISPWGLMELTRPRQACLAHRRAWFAFLTNERISTSTSDRFFRLANKPPGTQLSFQSGNTTDRGVAGPIAAYPQ